MTHDAKFSGESAEVAVIEAVSSPRSKRQRFWHSRPERRRSAATLLAQGLIASMIMLGVGATAAWAAWTTQVTVPGATISAGTLDLQFADVNDAAAGPNASFAKDLSSLPATGLTPTESTAFAISPMNAGDVETIYYTAEASTTASGAGVIQVQLFTGTPKVSSGTYPRKSICEGGMSIGPALSLNTAKASAISTPRPLKLSKHEALCVLVTVLPDAPSSAAAKPSPSIILDFTATQVAP